VIVDPSHAGGKAWMVPALSQAAIAAGADGCWSRCTRSLRGMVRCGSGIDT